MFDSLGQLLLFQMLRHIDFEEIDRVPNLAGAEHRIDGRKDHSGNGDDCPFLTSAFGNALIASAVHHKRAWGLSRIGLSEYGGSTMPKFFQSFKRVKSPGVHILDFVFLNEVSEMFLEPGTGIGQSRRG